jgi:hypothetical protein
MVRIEMSPKGIHCTGSPYSLISVDKARKRKLGRLGWDGWVTTQPEGKGAQFSSRIPPTVFAVVQSVPVRTMNWTDWPIAT